MSKTCENCFHCRMRIKVNTKRDKRNKYYEAGPMFQTKLFPKNPNEGLVMLFCRMRKWLDARGHTKYFSTYGVKFKKWAEDNVCMSWDGEPKEE